MRRTACLCCTRARARSGRAASDIDMSTEFQLVGSMLALAVYNGHTLDVAFPMVLWRCGLQGPKGPCLCGIKSTRWTWRSPWCCGGAGHEP